MGDVIQLNQPKKGDTAFMMCSCREVDPVPFMVVAIVSWNAPIITGLMCPECETQLDVISGVVQQDPRHMPS
jgi:hypothetical protein